ncbi:expressed unknown protein [Seminavis robusta]|uniref:Uncharacterized protein n=1 Tax=Seminavis robusta TaxID=568900 RepID=A0A9N8DAL0_9STRA|nr:expressed unknown protein [Seminavis robusta]|eukprot:Sro12_g009440.1 n/a (419) ;mRNA; r:127540-128796
MSAKVDTENATVEVPEASPDANDEKKDVHVAEAKLRSRRNLWIGLAVFLAVVLSLSIALPLSLKKGDSNERNENEVTTETNGEQAQPFGEPETPCAPPSPDNHCITQESHEQCMTLVNIGCKKIKSTRSCPPMHVCDDVVPGLNPAVQCPPPSPDNHCTTEESHQQCMTLVNSGCKKIRSTRSCPPMHQCDETPEQPEAVACTMDVKECADGSFVGRVAPNCDFEMCPGEVPVVAACTLELAYCPDGTPVGRSAPNCHFEACAGGACPMGTYTCDDGTELVRDPALGCEYPQCSTSPAQTNQESTPVACTLELKTCGDGSSVGRTGPNCEFEPCPEDLQLAACTMELAYCPDGTPVGRSAPNCTLKHVLEELAQWEHTLVMMEQNWCVILLWDVSTLNAALPLSKPIKNLHQLHVLWS